MAKGAAGAPLTLFLQILDIVLEDEKVRFALARDPNERLVVVFDNADHFLAILQFHPHRRGFFDQVLKVLGLLKRLFRCAPGLRGKWWRRNHLSCGLDFRSGATDVRAPAAPEPPSESP